MIEDDTVEVSGLSAILTDDPRHARLRPWLPGDAQGLTAVELTLRYRGEVYYAHLAGDREAGERIGCTMGGEWLGWMVKVTHTSEPRRGGGQSAGPVPDLETAILTALSCVYPLDAERERRARELAGGSGEDQ
jgi:hypothetical protein